MAAKITPGSKDAVLTKRPPGLWKGAKQDKRKPPIAIVQRLASGYMMASLHIHSQAATGGLRNEYT